MLAYQAFLEQQIQHQRQSKLLKNKIPTLSNNNIPIIDPNLRISNNNQQINKSNEIAISSFSTTPYNNSQKSNLQNLKSPSTPNQIQLLRTPSHPAQSSPLSQQNQFQSSLTLNSSILSSPRTNNNSNNNSINSNENQAIICSNESPMNQNFDINYHQSITNSQNKKSHSIDQATNSAGILSSQLMPNSNVVQVYLPQTQSTAKPKSKSLQSMSNMNSLTTNPSMTQTVPILTPVQPGRNNNTTNSVITQVKKNASTTNLKSTATKRQPKKRAASSTADSTTSSPAKQTQVKNSNSTANTNKKAAAQLVNNDIATAKNIATYNLSRVIEEKSMPTNKNSKNSESSIQIGKKIYFFMNQNILFKAFILIFK